MTRSFVAAVGFAACLSSINPSFAQPNLSDSTAATAMKPVTIKLHMTPQQRSQMVAFMKAGHKSCFVEDLDPNDDSSMIANVGRSPQQRRLAPNLVIYTRFDSGFSSRIDPHSVYVLDVIMWSIWDSTGSAVYRHTDQVCSQGQKPETAARSCPSGDIWDGSATNPYAGRSYGSTHDLANISDG